MLLLRIQLFRHWHEEAGRTVTLIPPDDEDAPTLHAARIDVHSANGFVRREIVQERVKTELFPAAAYRRGTWITYDLVSALS